MVKNLWMLWPSVSDYGALLALLPWGLVRSAALGLADTTTLGQTVRRRTYPELSESG
jgi:hypothetical protein